MARTGSAVERNVMSKGSGTKRYLRYTPHLVTYIDILGFRELIQKKSPNFISWAIRHVQEITVPNRHTNMHPGENYVNFSDLIVHTIPIHSDQNRIENIVLAEIQYIAMVQAVLIEKGLLLRGAITIGNIERTYGVLFGPGLISAYELERDYAQYSRIIVDGQLLDRFRSKHSLRALARYVRLDDDGLMFLDYLGVMQDALKNDQKSYYRLVETHKKLVDKNLLKFEKNRKVRSKYLWLTKYHNATVRATVSKTQQKRFFVDRPAIESRVPLLTQI
jgi:hypothetical protein